MFPPIVIALFSLVLLIRRLRERPESATIPVEAVAAQIERDLQRQRLSS